MRLIGITLEYLNRQKTEQDNLHRKLKINKNNSKEIVQG